MLTEFDYIRSIEKIRFEKKVSISVFTAGIMSRRTYSRVLGGETKIGLKELILLVERLELPLIEFIQYTHNTVFMEHLHEFEFLEAFYNENYEGAYNKYYVKMKSNSTRSPFSRITIPLTLLILEEKMKLITYDEFLRSANELINLDELLDNKLVLDDVVETLYYFVSYASKEQKKRIFNYLYKVFVLGQGKLLAHSIEVATLKSFIVMLRILDVKKENKHKIIRTLIAALSFALRANLAPLDIELAKHINDLNNKFQISPYIFLYYMSLLGATTLPKFDQMKKEIFTEENKGKFKLLYNQFIAGDKLLIEEIINEARKLI